MKYACGRKAKIGDTICLEAYYDTHYEAHCDVVNINKHNIDIIIGGMGSVDGVDPSDYILISRDKNKRFRWLGSLKYSICFLIICTIVTFAWRLYERFSIGYVESNMFDSIIATLLSLSVTLNFMYVCARKGER